MFVVLTSLLLTAGMCFGQSAPKDSGQNPGFPRVVAKLNLFNRTKSLGPQTLYVPKQSGVFRISAAIVCTIANNVESTDWAVSPGYTNEVGLNGGNPIASVPANFVSSSYNFYAPLIFNSSSNTPITIVISGPDNTGSQYNVYIVLEQLE
jgi:hypothetical protein